MTDDQFDAFWFRLDSRFAPVREVYVEAQTDQEAEALVVSMLARGCEVQMFSVATTARSSKGVGRGRSARSNRCNNCVACSARDCGICKNCRDKPRFGGPGIKKKACLARICRNAIAPRGGDDDDAEEKEDDDEEPYDADPHAALRIIDAAADEAAAVREELLGTIIDACKRQPLTPLRHSTSSSNLQGFDMLAQSAVQAIPC